MPSSEPSIINDIKKSPRGRPRKDTSPLTVRISGEELVALDLWIKKNGPPYVTRPEAMRRLVQKALDAEEGSR